MSVSVDTAIGLAVSRDQGLTFQRIGEGPVLAASLREPCLVGDGFVRIDPRAISHVVHLRHRLEAVRRRCRAGSNLQNRPCNLERRHRLGQGGGRGPSSTDRLGRGGEPGAADRNRARRAGFTCSSATASRSISETTPHAAIASGTRTRTTSSTGRETIGNPRSRALPGDWDSDMQCYPHVFECDRRTYLLYNGNEFGRHGFGAAVLE